MNQRKIKIGIAGFGRIVQKVYLPILKTHSNIEITGVYDPDKSITPDFAGKNCDSIDELLALNIEALIVAVPNYLHAPISISALNRGLHVLCEKPMAINADQARKMINAAEDTKKILMISFPSRYRPEIQLLKKIVKEGIIGPLQEISCGWLRNRGIPAGWFTRKEYSGGGTLIDLGSHLIDIVADLAGNSSPVNFSCNSKYEYSMESTAAWYRPTNDVLNTDSDVETEAEGDIRFDNGVKAFLKVSWNAETAHDRTFIFARGESGEAVVETLFGFSERKRPALKPLSAWNKTGEIDLPFKAVEDPLEPYALQIQEFIDVINAPQTLNYRLPHDLLVTQIIDGLYRAQGASVISSGASANL